MPLPTLLPSSARGRSKPGLSSSSSWSGSPDPEPYSHIPALHAALASLPEDIFDSPNMKPPRPPALMTAHGPPTGAVVKSAFAAAQGDPSHPRWGHIINAARLTCTRRKLYPAAYVNPPPASSQKARVGKLVATAEEWLAWEAGERSPLSTRDKGKAKERTGKVAKLHVVARQKVQRWQQAIAASGSSDPPEVLPIESQDHEHQRPAKKARGKIMFKAAKRTGLPMVAAPAGKKHGGPASVRDAHYGANASRVAGDHRTDTTIKPRDAHTGALPPSKPAPRIRDLPSDSPPLLFLSQQTLRPTPPQTHPTLSCPADLPSTLDIAADRIRAHTSSDQGAIHAPSPSRLVSLSPPMSSKEERPVSHAPLGKRGRPLTPSSDGSYAPPAAKRPCIESDFVLQARAPVPADIIGDVPLLPSSGPGAHITTPPRSSITPVCRTPRRQAHSDDPAFAPDDAQPYVGEPPALTNVVCTRAQLTPFRVDPEAEARAVRQAEAGPLPNLTELLKMSARKTAQNTRLAHRRRTADTRKVSGAGPKGVATAATKETAGPTLLEALPAFSQHPDLFAPTDASIMGQDLDGPPATPTPVVNAAISLSQLALGAQCSAIAPELALKLPQSHLVPERLRSPSPLVSGKRSSQLMGTPREHSTEEPGQMRSPLPMFTQQSHLFNPADASFFGPAARVEDVPTLPGPEFLRNSEGSILYGTRASQHEAISQLDYPSHHSDDVLPKEPGVEPIPTFTQNPNLFAPTDASFNGADHFPHSDARPQVGAHGPAKPMPPSSPLASSSFPSQIPGLFATSCTPVKGVENVASSLPSLPLGPQDVEQAITAGAHADFLGVGLSPSSYTLGGSGDKLALSALSGTPPAPCSSSGIAGERVAFGGIPMSSQLEGDVEADVDDVSQFMARDVDLNGWSNEG